MHSRFDMPGSNGEKRRPQPSPWPPLRRPEMSCSAVSRVIGCATTGLLIRAGACRHLVELISWREVSVRAHDAVCTNVRPPRQDTVIANLGSGVEVLHLHTGHDAKLSRPAELAAAIESP